LEQWKLTARARLNQARESLFEGQLGVVDVSRAEAG
jgi:hypothetical protein